MKRPLAIAVLVFCVSIIVSGYSPGSYEPSTIKRHEYIDSTLIVTQQVRKVKEVRTTEELERRRWDWDGPENNTKLTNVQTTWTTFDKSGRVVAIDDTLVDDKYNRTEITNETFYYSGNKMIERQLTLHYSYESYGPKDSTVRIEIVKWSDGLTWRQLEWADYGQWIVHIDSTVLNSTGMPHVTYTHNSMGDSFVEEYVYDAKARLKYRRLAMKQLWSPPWEMEASLYTYADDGSYVQRDSVWRIDPDMNRAAQLAGDRNSPGYEWRVLLMAPSMATFHRLESWEEWTYNADQLLVRKQTWTEYAHTWYDYSWSYNSQGQIVRETEWRCTRWHLSEEPEIGNKDSVWYMYKNGKLASKEEMHSISGDAERSKNIFGAKDPNRTEISDYCGRENYSKVHKRYDEDRLMETMYFGKDGLISKWEGYTSTYVLSDEREYTYFKW